MVGKKRSVICVVNWDEKICSIIENQGHHLNVINRIERKRKRFVR